jgi:hypothetical protein
MCVSLCCASGRVFVYSFAIVSYFYFLLSLERLSGIYQFIERAEIQGGVGASSALRALLRISQGLFMLGNSLERARCVLRNQRGGLRVLVLGTKK